MKLCATCLFGIESLVADELRYNNFNNVVTETGRVVFEGDQRDLVRANLLLRTAERVYILMGEFPARTFDELFEGVKALPWEDYIDKNGQFPVKGSSLDSALHSIPDCQAIIKKASAVRLCAKYGFERMPETGAVYQIRFFIMKDKAILYLDASGASLHKRGYRPASNAAPLRETLAAAMVKISRFKGRDVFIDPFCGSGTIAIEAALAAINRAPGINRSFAAENWKTIDSSLWPQEREALKAAEYRGEYKILASDIDPASVKLAKENARRAGVAEFIDFSVADALKLDLPSLVTEPFRKGLVITNPPYGMRLLEASAAEEIYKGLGKRWRNMEDWSFYILSSSMEFEKNYGKVAKKRRKLYNGMIQCQLYMYF
jgi:putative N6-adenine-specific DNA methylase